MKRILIAHQSTIPHYRIPFYNTLQLQKPTWWTFDVVFDKKEVSKQHFFNEQIDIRDFQFSILDTKTVVIPWKEKKICYQTFWFKARKYDLIIVENALNNIAYPLNQIHQKHQHKFAYWGHGKDRSINSPSLFKSICEKIKLSLLLKSDGFFAYTDGIKKYLIDKGFPADRIFVINNTIDINHQRLLFSQNSARRYEILDKMGLNNRKVLLFVGRFTANKRIDFLLESFSYLTKIDPAYFLLLVGSGGKIVFNKDIKYLGPMVKSEQLARLYIAADIFVFPGSVGLGPLHALCYDLPVVTIDSSFHMPEIEYLNSQNSLTLAINTTPEKYAYSIHELMSNREQMQKFKQQIWPSIKHLTIENMAQRFIDGINHLLS